LAGDIKFQVTNDLEAVGDYTEPEQYCNEEKHKMKLHLTLLAAITTLLVTSFAMAQDTLVSPSPEGA
jgi:hypothetical protein